MCPKCGKVVPKLYRSSHAIMHLDTIGDVKYVKDSKKGHKNIWEALKYSVKIAEENKLKLITKKSR